MAVSRIWDRLGALSGAVGTALVVAFLIISDPYDENTNPNPIQPSAALARAYVDNRDDARTGSYLCLVGAFLLLWFLGYLRRHLQLAEGEDGWLASVAYGGGLVAVGLLLLEASVGFAVSELAAYGADTQVAKTFFVYQWTFFVVLAPPLGALAAATTVAAFRFAALPRLLAWAGALVVIAMIGLTPSAHGFVAVVGLGWIALLSLALFVETWRSGRGALPRELDRALSDAA